ncbi:hypothetical protein ACFSC6_11445 [Rufibacter sediminis]|uniref:Uncharacterized protein n=1 Tax=Rufibacter sediminis TaxID=2762756 RepID=A0ABR6VTI2_9BACT|nr:hypothetical protein [Rufibacter sediminis]MBC3540493.1 hypothetical protein [Rufibacter sediminis]
MKTVLPFAAAVLLTFSACSSKEAEETPISSSETIEESTNATDVAETTAAPIDSTGLSRDSVASDI